MFYKMVETNFQKYFFLNGFFENEKFGPSKIYSMRKIQQHDNIKCTVKKSRSVERYFDKDYD